MKKTVALVIPAFNEAQTIEAVIQAFDSLEEDFAIWVVDNNSHDSTGTLAQVCLDRSSRVGGVIRELQPGKGAAIRRALLEIEADIFVLCDGDMTYPAEKLPDLLSPILAGTADMVVGDRHSLGAYAAQNKRPLHNLGNKTVTSLVNFFFNSRLRDIMSGFRAFNGRVADLYPALVEGFEIETDLTLFALDKKLRIVEIPIRYSDRPEGSESKLRTLRDGFKVLSQIFAIVRFYKPLQFFGFFSLACIALGLTFGSVPVLEFVRTAIVTHVPLAILAIGTTLTGIVLFATALILDSLSKNSQENFQIQIRKVRLNGE
jgi:glycosyltransferase involved in cell wall biosynthesis